MKKIILILIMSFLTTSAVAGTILLMGVGLGSPGGGGGGCSNSLDFSDSCNSQYITVI